MIIHFMIGFFSLKTDRMYAGITIQLDKKYPERWFPKRVYSVDDIGLSLKKRRLLRISQKS
jgi:hypothetical protein